MAACRVRCLDWGPKTEASQCVDGGDGFGLQGRATLDGGDVDVGQCIEGRGITGVDWLSSQALGRRTASHLGMKGQTGPRGLGTC